MKVWVVESTEFWDPKVYASLGAAIGTTLAEIDLLSEDSSTKWEKVEPLSSSQIIITYSYKLYDNNTNERGSDSIIITECELDVNN